MQNGLGAITKIDYELLTLTDHYMGLLESNLGSVVVPGKLRCTYLAPGEPDECFTLPDTTRKTADRKSFYRLLNTPFSNVTDAESFASVNKHPVLEYRAPIAMITRVEGSAPKAGMKPRSVDQNAFSAIEYLYEHARFQAAGRGFLGFKKLSTIDVQTGVATATTYCQDWPFIGYPHKTERITASGDRLSLSTLRYGLTGWQDSWKTRLAASTTGVKALGVVKPYTIESQEQAYRTKTDTSDPKKLIVSQDVLQTKSIINRYDAFGNVESTTTKTEGAGLHLTKKS